MSRAPELLRLFVAADPPVEILEDLRSEIEPYREIVADARWAPVANQHLTLKFLGSVPADDLPPVVVACRAASQTVAPSGARVAGLGAFPSARRARVLWAGIEDPDEVLGRLAASLDEKLAPLGFEAEKRRYTPHLTQARLKVPRDVRPIVERVEFRSSGFRIADFHLYRSRLSPKGARYEMLESFVLSNI